MAVVMAGAGILTVTVTTITFDSTRRYIPHRQTCPRRCRETMANSTSMFRNTTQEASPLYSSERFNDSYRTPTLESVPGVKWASKRFRCEATNLCTPCRSHSLSLPLLALIRCVPFLWQHGRSRLRLQRALLRHACSQRGSPPICRSSICTVQHLCHDTRAEPDDGHALRHHRALPGGSPPAA